MDFSVRIAFRLIKIAFLALVLGATTSVAQDCNEQCQAARKAQDPLAPVRAIFTDNTIGYGPNSSDATYNFQIQPAYTIEGDAGNIILRAVIPVLGNPGGSGSEWGIGDAVVQGFYVPNNQDGFKFGFGPQVSLKTRSNKSFAGAGFGAGFAVVGFGFAGDLAYGGILDHMWGEDGASSSTIQPIIYYNLDFFGVSYFGYNNSLVYNWDSGSANPWTIPVGLTVGKTFLLKSGYAIDANIGAYKLVNAQSCQNDMQLKFGVSILWS